MVGEVLRPATAVPLQPERLHEAAVDLAHAGDLVPREVHVRAPLLRVERPRAAERYHGEARVGRPVGEHERLRRVVPLEIWRGTPMLGDQEETFSMLEWDLLVCARALIRGSTYHSSSCSTPIISSDEMQNFKRIICQKTFYYLAEMIDLKFHLPMFLNNIFYYELVLVG